MGIGELGELLRRSTVHVRSSDVRGQSAGSGVIWDSAGTIVTNAHVLGQGTHVVELWDGRSFPAEIQARDEPRDLAKLKLPALGLPAASPRSSPVKPGELVIAVGNPLGFTGALTTGVVHAVGPFSGFGRKPWVQASIRLAPGNSGGPLADAAGQVVGINTMLASGGIALAIPTAVVLEFIKNGARPRLGVTVQVVRLPRRRGAGLLIMSIENGSPAERASLLIGDILIGTPETRFTTAADLFDAIEEARSRLPIRFLRGDHTRERQVIVSLWPLHAGGSLIRVWIDTASTVTRAGLESLLEASGGIEMVSSPSQADVVLLDELPDRPGAAPAVLLSDEPLTSRMLRLGIHAILPREAPRDQIVAALYAASAGLVAVPAESSSLIVPAATESIVENLTRREMGTLEMLAEGLSNKQIAGRLSISEHTAKFHVNSILGKLDAATRTEAVMRGLRSGLLKV